MSDTPVYVVANFIVHDAAAYREYEKGFFSILKRHEGTFLRYDDADYQALSEHRRAGTDLQFLTMVHGLPPRG
jgi:uncharacterized protein (DUF1330 family)